MDSPVQKIKDVLSIEEVVSSYIQLEKTGENFKAKCPFHNEKTPSFFVSPSRNSYYCFGCGAKGDIFSFVQNFEGLDFKGSLKVLADRAGISLSGFNLKEENNKEKIFKILEEATLFFVNNLQDNEDVVLYLKNRGLRDDTIKLFRIGFARDAWRDLFFYLKSKGFKEEDIYISGLAKKSEKGMYDVFRSRIIFPIFDSSGRVIAFSGRYFSKNNSGKDGVVLAKYLNSPETPVFNKSAVLYGLNFAKDSIRKNNFVILVEGQMDLILSHQIGFKNTVASSGTALSENILNDNFVSNLGLVRRLTPNIILAFDGDEAGLKATSRAVKIGFVLEMDIKIPTLPEDKDPADFILEHGKEGWSKLIKESKNIIEFFLDRIIELNKDKLKIAKEIRNKILPYLAFVKSSVERSALLKLISDKSNLPIYSLEEDLNFIINNTQKVEEQKSETSTVIEFLRKDFILKRLIGIFFWQNSLIDKKLDVNLLLEKMLIILNIEENELINQFVELKEDLIYEAEVFYSDNDNLLIEVNELLISLEEEFLKNLLTKKMAELDFLEKNKNKESLDKVLKDYQEIINKIESLKK